MRFFFLCPPFSPLTRGQVPFRMQEDVVVHAVFYLALDTTVRYGLGGLRTTR